VYEERMVIAHPPADVLERAPYVLSAAGFHNIRTFPEQWTISATKWRPGQWASDPVNLFLYTDPQGTQVIAQCNATPQSLFSLATNPSQVYVRGALAALLQL
jgi:hypothetical protein